MRYWAYLNGEVPGSFSPEQLAAASGVTGATLVCPAEGEIDEKSWRRAGEFEEIARALAARPAPAAASAPAVAAAAASASAATPTDVDSMLDSASSKLFHHVADLMKELENRREERALVVSLQRQVAALKDELAKEHDRTTMSELKVTRLAELEDAARKDQAAIASLQSSLQTREQAHNEARISLEKMKTELDSTRRRQAEAYNDLAVRNRLVDKLSKDLTDKELSLAKSLGVIRRLEEDLNRLCPPPPAAAAPAEAPARPAPPSFAASVPEPVAPPPAPPAAQALPPAAPAEAAAPSAPAVEPVRELSVPAAPTPAGPLPTVTADEPPQAPPYLEPTPGAAAASKPQQALAAFLKRFFPGQPH